MRRYGYIDRLGRADRMNFGGRYFHGVPCQLTGLTLFVEGFDYSAGKIQGSGRIVLMKGEGREPAAAWPFAELLSHWGRKHAKAVYVPSMCRTSPQRSSSFADTVRLGGGTNYVRFLRAVVDGCVFYDPGIKLEHLNTKPVVKRRSQFRIASGDLPRLYDSMAVAQVG